MGTKCCGWEGFRGVAIVSWNLCLSLSAELKGWVVAGLLLQGLSAVREGCRHTTGSERVKGAGLDAISACAIT